MISTRCVVSINFSSNRIRVLHEMHGSLQYSGAIVVRNASIDSSSRVLDMDSCGRFWTPGAIQADEAIHPKSICRLLLHGFRGFFTPLDLGAFRRMFYIQSMASSAPSSLVYWPFATFWMENRLSHRLSVLATTYMNATLCVPMSSATVLCFQ